MGKEKLIPLAAMIVILIGAGSSAYVYATQTTTDNIIINGQQYTIDQIFYIAEPRTFDSLNFSGIALDDLIIKTGGDLPNVLSDLPWAMQVYHLVLL